MPVIPQPELFQFLLQLSTLGFYAICAVVASLTIVGSIAFWRGPEKSAAAWAFTRLLERGEAAKLVTIILIVLSVTMLGLLRIVQSEGLISILSGIGGYVLGGLHRSTRSEDGEGPPA